MTLKWCWLKFEIRVQNFRELHDIYCERVKHDAKTEQRC